ncbi:hypothetical protein MBLNU230_g3939t1 [Neophaeotheca triangularis]
MKILDAGTEPLENAAVLDWIRRKRSQHQREDSEWTQLVESKGLITREPQNKTPKSKDRDREKDRMTPKESGKLTHLHRWVGSPVPTRPNNYLKALAQHSDYLTNAKIHPHVRNPTAYFPARERERRVQLFVQRCVEAVAFPLEEQFAASLDLGGDGYAVALERLKTEQEKKEFSEAEVLMVCNLAPTCKELLEPCLEDWEERFSWEEMEAIVQVVVEVWRGEEYGFSAEGGGGGVEGEGNWVGAEDGDGLEGEGGQQDGGAEMEE